MVESGDSSRERSSFLFLIWWQTALTECCEGGQGRRERKEGGGGVKGEVRVRGGGAGRGWRALNCPLNLLNPSLLLNIDDPPSLPYNRKRGRETETVSKIWLSISRVNPTHNFRFVFFLLLLFCRSWFPSRMSQVARWWNRRQTIILNKQQGSILVFLQAKCFRCFLVFFSSFASFSFNPPLLKKRLMSAKCFSLPPRIFHCVVTTFSSFYLICIHSLK